MNERIKELEIEANLYADEFWERKSSQWHQFYTEKFAQLIVKECLYQVADVRIENDFEPVGDAVLVRALAGIKKYFGVEE